MRYVEVRLKGVLDNSESRLFGGPEGRLLALLFEEGQRLAVVRELGEPRQWSDGDVVQWTTDGKGETYTRVSSDLWRGWGRLVAGDASITEWVEDKKCAVLRYQAGEQ